MEPNSTPAIAGHITALIAIAAAWVGLLSPILTGLATILAIIWYSLQIITSLRKSKDDKAD